MSLSWLIRLAVLFVAMAVLLILAELARRRRRLDVIFTRKVIHTAMGLVILLTPLIFHAKYPALLVAVMLFLIDLLVIRFSDRFGREYTTYGILYYPLAVFVLILLCWDEYIYVLMGAICVMSFGDGFAALVGTRVGRNKFSLTGDLKTLEGSLGMYVASAFSLFVVLLAYSKSFLLSLLAALLVPIVATVVEAASSKGLDNITVPAVSAVLIYYLFSYGPISAVWLAISILAAAVLSFVAFVLNTLTANGAAAAFILGSLVFTMGKLNGALALVTFFATSSILSNIGKGAKREARALLEKTSRRDMAQAFANGGVPLFLVSASMFNPCWWAYLLFLAALASVTADTWATEIGTILPGRPLSLRTLTRVPKGTSGAVSALGTLGCIVGSCLIGLFAGLHKQAGGFSVASFVIVSIAGFMGCAVDSVLGATLQAQYARAPRGQLTEVHKEGMILARGFPWMRNDMVNFISSATAAMICFLILIILSV